MLSQKLCNSIHYNILSQFSNTKVNFNVKVALNCSCFVVCLGVTLFSDIAAEYTSLEVKRENFFLLGWRESKILSQCVHWHHHFYYDY